MNKELIQKYCNNSCTDEELSIVLAWFEECASTTQGKSLLFQIWDDLDEEVDIKNVSFDLMLDKIHHIANLNQSERLLEKANQNIVKFKRRENFIRILTRVAAVLMIPILVLGLYMSSRYYSFKQDHVLVSQSYNEVFSSVDAITKVTLPDGSMVWLNHSSTLRYPATFREKYRTVELEGEGYFEVAHNPKIPFIVKTGEIEVVALGTTFNIMAYPDEGKIETSLINGSVKLQKVETDGSIVQLLNMQPTDLAVYNKSNNQISKRNIFDDRYFAWKDGRLIFNEEPMGEVVKKLSRWFNVDIKIKDPELLEITYTATFVQETLPQVLELLTMMSPVSYSISNREEINSSKSFSKREVILSYKKK